MSEFETYIERLLHYEEENSNKFIDLYSVSGMAFFLKRESYKGSISNLMYEIIKDRIGKIATTVLKGSALSDAEQIVGASLNVFEWCDTKGEKEPKRLDAFKTDALKQTTAKGNNPVFLSLGALRYTIPVGTESREILSPLLIFPIRLLRSGGATQPISVEFIDDDIFFNPSLYYKLKVLANKNFVDGLPLPAEDIDCPMNLATFRLDEYFNRLEAYLEGSLKEGGGAGYLLERDTVAISMYNNPDICMYYDLKRNKDKILQHPLIRSMFFKEEKAKDCAAQSAGKHVIEPPFVLPYDGKQFTIMQRIIAGESLVIQGPPGTGKTQTIANLIAALLADGKRILFSSKKNSALAEVYNKMPEALRPFLLLMDYESEAESAIIDVKYVHKALQETLSFQTEGKETQLLAKRSAAYDKKFAAIKNFEHYRDLMFRTTRISSGNFYAALDSFCKNMEIEPVEFEMPLKVLNVTHGDYLAALEKVKKTAEYWNRLTEKDSISIRLNPWFSVKPEAACENKVFDEANTLAAFAEKLNACADYLKEANPEKYRFAQFFNLELLKTLSSYNLPQEDTAKLLALKDLKGFSEQLKRAGADLRVNAERMDWAKKRGAKIFTADLSYGAALQDLYPAGGLRIALLQRLANAKHIFDDKTGALQCSAGLSVLVDMLRMYRTSVSEAKLVLQDITSVFAEEKVNDGKINLILTKAYGKLKRYIIDPRVLPKPLDFAGNAAYNKVRALTRAPKYTDFRAICLALQAVQTYNRYQNEAAKMSERINLLFHADVTDQEATDLLEMAEVLRADGKEDFAKRVKSILLAEESILAALKNVEIDASEQITLGELISLYKVGELHHNMQRHFAELKEQYSPLRLERETPEYYDNLSAAANALYVLTEVYESGNFAMKVDEAGKNAEICRYLSIVQGWQKEVNILEFTKKLTEFYDRYFTNSAYSELSSVQLKDLSGFAARIRDKAQQAAAVSYRVQITAPCVFKLQAFFSPFELEPKRKKGFNFADIFEHSFYYLMIEAVKACMKEDIYSFTRDLLTENIQSLRTAESELLELNSARTAMLAASRFKPADRRFDFLRANTAYTACRRMFKERAADIMTLKQCLIMSPSTVSLLLRRTEFEEFDVAIIDEASQMPPEYVIPIAYRAKQCVVVGDENQMPPIKHFVRVSEPQDEEDGMESITSALELIKQNESFACEKLASHYRSMTETLIEYSQKRYYPDMVTFPTVQPRSRELGLFDVFLADGFSEKGENIAEAIMVVKKLNEHFERFYDGETKTLKHSVGVVTFGKSQSDLVSRLIEKDRALSKKLSEAMGAESVPEKVFFLRNIETVQGQEIDHLILSVTYGKRGNGTIYQNFGQLNGKLGERIFNVAVTRAKHMVTVIHSVRASEITEDRILYIKDYLRSVERFDTDDAGRQFISDGKPNGFTKSVAKFIESLGFEKSRIVTDYGVTENSVRVPIALLSKDGSRALAGIYVETEPRRYDYIDQILRYPDTLAARGWKLYPVYVFDWVRNTEAEKQRLKEFIAKETIE